MIATHNHGDHIGSFSAVMTNAANALNGTQTGGEVLGPNPEFSPDMTSAIASAAKLGALDFDDAFFGHGEPIEGGAAAAVAALAATLVA